MVDPAELAALAVDIAEAAGRVLLEGRSRVRTSVDTKSTRTDMVTEMDRASEALIASRLRTVRPDDAIVGEEGTANLGTTGVRWIFDPLDGTTNYLYGFPYWAVSIAAEIDDRVAVGVVHHPLLAETFTAVAGEGASCNGDRLVVRGASDLATALVGTGFSYDAAVRGHQARLLTHLLPAVRDVRRAGAAALDLCWVAAGRLDIFFERDLALWDWVAGSLVAAEAGAVCTTLDDGTHVATPPHLLEPFLGLLAAAGRAPG